MAAGRIVLSQYFPARDRNGRLVPGALLYVYTNGTTTKASIYAEKALSTPLANPVAANSSGQFPAIWASDAVQYTLSITAADGSSIGNPSVFDDYSVSTDADTASVALAEAAAAATEADLAAILAIQASGDDAAAINARARKDSNLSDLTDASTATDNLRLLQTGTGATAESLGVAFRRLGVFPEQFGAAATYSAAVDDTAFIQAAIDRAANWASAAFAQTVHLSRLYKITGTILKRPYVTIVGVGMARSGFMQFMSDGPVLDFDAIVNTSSCYLDDLRTFRIDGTNATGTAYAIRCQGQKHSRWTRLGYWNYKNTTVYPVQIVGACYEILQDQCFYLNCALFEKIARTPESFPTQITHRDCWYDDSPTGTGDAILIDHATGCSWIGGGAQACGQLNLFAVRNSSTVTTTTECLWDTFYIEDNGGGQSGANTWRFVGHASNPITNCTIINPRIHGSAPNGRHIYAENTVRLRSVDNYAISQAWLTDGGGNTEYEIDTRFVGTSDLGSYASVAGGTWLCTTDGVERARATSAGLSAKVAFLIDGVKLADRDGTNHRILAPDGDVTAYFGATENAFANTSHRFGSTALAADFAIINSTGIRSNGSFLLGTRTALDNDGTFTRVWTGSGTALPVQYHSATESYHRNATHIFRSADFATTFLTLNSAALNLGTGMVFQINGTQVLGARGAAVADATDAASAITQLNALLARCRAHGLIAT